MQTKEEVQAKSEATRLKNLLARKAENKRPLSKSDETILKALKAKATPKTPKRERRDFSQIAWDVVQQAGATTAERDWLTEPASTKWTGRKIRNKKTHKDYVICDVFGEMHVEIEKNAKTTIHNAASLRKCYDPVLAEVAYS